MGTFFKPLRRKFGVVTLGLACVLMVGWVRSLSAEDRIDLWNDTWLTSSRGPVSWERWNFVHMSPEEAIEKQICFPVKIDNVELKIPYW